jgi:multiple sugar transport system substrate-binding protein
VIEDFEAKNAGITIESIPVGVSDIVNQVITMSSGGNPPDVVQSQTLFTPTFIAAGLPAALDDSATILDQVPEAALDLVRGEDGSLYGLPWSVFPLGFHYDRNLMTDVGLDPESPPQTLEEMVTQIETARAADPSIVGFNLDSTIRDIGLDFNWPLMLAFDAAPLKDGVPDADTPEMVAYLDWVKSLFDDGHTVPGLKFGEFRPYAAEGAQLFIIDGPYFKGIVQGTNTEITDEVFLEQWGVTGVPAGPDGVHRTVSSDHHLIMLDSSDAKEASLRFMEYLVTDPFAIETYVIALGGIPALNDVSDFSQLDNDYYRSFIEDVGAGAVRPPYGEKYVATAEIVMRNMQRLFSTGDSSADIAASIQTELEELYSG